MDLKIYDCGTVCYLHIPDKYSHLLREKRLHEIVKIIREDSEKGDDGQSKTKAN